jgi:hypothetical protein
VYATLMIVFVSRFGFRISYRAQKMMGMAKAEQLWSRDCVGGRGYRWEELSMPITLAM